MYNKQQLTNQLTKGWKCFRSCKGFWNWSL